MTGSLPGTFRVDVQQLSSLAGRLDECASEMKSAGYKMEQASVHDIGHGGLEARCGEFRDAWTYGIGRLAKLTDAIRGGVQTTASNYAEADRRIADIFQPGGPGVASAGSGGAAAPSGVGAGEEARARSHGMADDFG